MSEKVIMSAEDMRRAWTRIAHEVIERNHGCDGLRVSSVSTRNTIESPETSAEARLIA